MINTVVDTYHRNTIDFAQLRAGGIVAVIHKGTQGTSFRDPTYQARKMQAKEVGLLWGSYHFSTGEEVPGQVENFLMHVDPQDDELVALDWESSDGPDMTLDQAREFVSLIHHELGRWPLLYGGHLLRESVGLLHDDVLANCPLWYARYSASPIGIPINTWKECTLWQYTDGDHGPQPRETLGASGADRNIYFGTEDDLRTSWPLTHRGQNTPQGQALKVLTRLNRLNPAWPTREDGQRRTGSFVNEEAESAVDSGPRLKLDQRCALAEESLEKILSAELGAKASTLYLIPQDGSSPSKLPFNWLAAKNYYSSYCSIGDGNDCPDGDFPLDCTHFVCHGLSKTKILVNLPTATCQNGVCIRVADLAAAFKNSVGKYTNVRRIDDLSTTREGDFCFVVSWFGLSKDHAMVLADTISESGGKVFGHTNSRCGEKVDLTDQNFLIYRIE